MKLSAKAKKINASIPHDRLVVMSASFFHWRAAYWQLAKTGRKGQFIILTGHIAYILGLTPYKPDTPWEDAAEILLDKYPNTTWVYRQDIDKLIATIIYLHKKKELPEASRLLHD